MIYVSGECTIEEDNCTSGKRCYEEVTWTDATNFCGCLPHSGWTGDDCTELTPGFTILRSFEICIMIATWLLLLWGIPRDLKAVNYSFTEFKKWKGLAENWFYSVTAMTSLSATILIKTFIYFEPKAVGHHSLPYDDLTQNSSIVPIIYELFNFAFIFFGTLAFFNISLTWVEQARRVQLFIMYDDNYLKVKKVRYIIRIVALISLAITVLIGAGVQNQFSTLMIILVCDVAITSSYWYGHRQLTTILFETNQQLKFTFYYKMVKRTYYRVIACFILATIGGILTAVDYNDYRHRPEKNPPEMVSKTEIGFDVLLLGILVGQGAVYIYLRQVFDGPSEEEKQQFYSVVRTIDSTSFQTKNLAAKLSTAKGITRTTTTGSKPGFAKTNSTSKAKEEINQEENITL